MQSAKETASNIAASAKSGLEKTKATMQEKAEKLTTTDPVQKEMATQKKEERIHEAERLKQETRQHNAANKQAAAVTGGQPTEYSTGGDFSTEHRGVTGRALETDTPTGGAARVGLPTRNPTGTATGGTARVPPQDPNVAGGASTGYGSGNTF